MSKDGGMGRTRKYSWEVGDKQLKVIYMQTESEVRSLPPETTRNW